MRRRRMETGLRQPQLFIGSERMFWTALLAEVRRTNQLLEALLLETQKTARPTGGPGGFGTGGAV